MGKKYILFVAIPVLAVLFLTVLSTTACVNPIDNNRGNIYSSDNISSTFLSIEINNENYTHGSSAPIQLLAGEIFNFKVLLQNTGTTTWGRDADAGQHGATLFSLGDPSHDENDFNDTFGTFFVLYPMQSSLVVRPGQTMTYDTVLRAPEEAGTYTMRWQTAEWPFGLDTTNHRSSNFFGKEIVVSIVVNEKEDQVNIFEPRDGVLDASDFEYVGSFRLPELWPFYQRELYGGFADEKIYLDSGIALREVEIEPGVFEKRLLALTGTYQNRLYEVAIPELTYINTSLNSLPIAEKRNIFSGQYNLLVNNGLHEQSWTQGGMWYDQDTELLYWTNNIYYPASGNYAADTAIVFYARLQGEGDSAEIVDRQSWIDNRNSGAPVGSYMGGVTLIPGSFAEAYLGGQRSLALGFGGAGSITTTRSLGPALGAVPLNGDGTLQDNVQAIMYYPYHATDESTRCIRDGNYFPVGNSLPMPASLWEGRWTNNDIIRSGVFIEYGDKRAYLTFPHQVTGRVAYDFAGYNLFGQYQSAWYFYDWEDLGDAINGTKTGLTPSSIHIVNYPSSHAALPSDGFVSGSCFDPETGRLYLYVKRANGSQPLVHVYQVLF